MRPAAQEVTMSLCKYMSVFVPWSLYKRSSTMNKSALCIESALCTRSALSNIKEQFELRIIFALKVQFRLKVHNVLEVHFVWKCTLHEIYFFHSKWRGCTRIASTELELNLEQAYFLSILRKTQNKKTLSFSKTQSIFPKNSPKLT